MRIRILANLLAQCGMGPGAERDTVIDSIFDWRDSNRDHRLNGAEEDYYRALDPPYSCKDGPFDLPEELLLVRGMKPVYFTGGAEGSKDYGALRGLVTVCPVTFMPATAPQRLLDALGQTRPAGPAAIPDESFFRVLASGRSGTGPAQRARRGAANRRRRWIAGVRLTILARQPHPRRGGEGAER